MPHDLRRDRAATIGRLFPGAMQPPGGFVLTRNLVRRLAIPHEEEQGQWIELRRLSWSQLDQARRARTDAALRNLADQPGEVRELMRASASERQAIVAEVTDPMAEFDLGTLLRLGIVAWSYAEPVSDETIADLDAETADWAAREIVKPAQRTVEDRADRMFPASPGA